MKYYYFISKIYFYFFLRIEYPVKIRILWISGTPNIQKFTDRIEKTIIRLEQSGSRIPTFLEAKSVAKGWVLNLVNVLLHISLWLFGARSQLKFCWGYLPLRSLRIWKQVFLFPNNLCSVVSIRNMFESVLLIKFKWY